MPLKKEISLLYRPKKGLPEKFAHARWGIVSLSKLRLSIVQEMEKEGLFVKVQKRKKETKEVSE